MSSRVLKVLVMVTLALCEKSTQDRDFKVITRDLVDQDFQEMNLGSELQTNKVLGLQLIQAKECVDQLLVVNDFQDPVNQANHKKDLLGIVQNLTVLIQTHVSTSSIQQNQFVAVLR